MPLRARQLIDNAGPRRRRGTGAAHNYTLRFVLQNDDDRLQVGERKFGLTIARLGAKSAGREQKVAYWISSIMCINDNAIALGGH